MPSLTATGGSLSSGDAVWPVQISCFLAVMKGTGSGRRCIKHHEKGLQTSLELMLCLQQAQKGEDDRCSCHPRTLVASSR